MCNLLYSTQVEEHQCEVIGCTKDKGKICPHVKAQCANYGGGHMANFSRCILKQKADVQASKEKKLKKKVERKRKSCKQERRCNWG